MKRVDGLTGKNFLIGVFAIYALFFFFTYFYFFVSSPLIVGKAIAGLPAESNSLANDSALIKTLLILVVLVAFIFFVFILPKIIHMNHLKSKKIEIKKYSPFKN